MSPKLPRVTARDLLRALHRAGWVDDHATGSHRYLRHPDRSGLVTVPFHAGRILRLKTLESILDQSGISADDLRALL